MKTVSRTSPSRNRPSSAPALLLPPLYSLLAALSLLLASPWWLWQMARSGKYREGLWERLGRIPSRLARPRARTIWLHAVSVGEVLAASHLIDELALVLPDTPVYVSTTTRTGQALARERFGAGRVFYFPLDFAFAMRAWLRFLRPAVTILVESEFWPRMLVECRRAGIPVALVNGRISDRSWPRYRRLGPIWRPLLGLLALALAQSEQDSERLRSLGATHARSVGNLKYDIRVAAPAALTASLRAHLPPATQLVVCGSTLVGEEELLLRALPVSAIVTILAPRQPERFDEVARLLADLALPHVRRSEWLPGSNPLKIPPLRPGTVLLLDSIGELASVYSLASLAIVGGSFLGRGGHNPLEPAQFGVPVLMGLGYANFRDIVRALEAKEAIILTDPADLETIAASLLADSRRMAAIGGRGRQVFAQEAGATARCIQALLTLLGEHSAVTRESQPSAAGENVAQP